MSDAVLRKRKLAWWQWGGLAIVGLAAVSALRHPVGEMKDQPKEALPATAQADFERANKHFLDTVVPCQKGAMTVLAALKHPDRYDIYDQATRVKNICGQASLEADSVKYTEATPQPFRDKLNADLADCGRAYVNYAVAMDSLSAVANGDMRPSAVTKASTDLRRGETRTGDCMETYVADLKASGVKLPGQSNKD